MRLLILSFLWIFGVFNEPLECVQCDGRIVSLDKTCSNCTGDYCFSIKYNYKHWSFQGQTALYQGCMTTPTAMKTGCVTNENGDTMCFCNDSDYCNQSENFTPSRIVPYMNCSLSAEENWQELSCPDVNFCLKTMEYGTSQFLYCNEYDVEILNYDLMVKIQQLFLPINSCYAVDMDVNSVKYYCGYQDNRKLKLKTKSLGKVKCFVQGDTKNRFKNTTCISQFCFSSTHYFGCIAQFNAEGEVLKPGLHQLTPFISPFYICDKDFCNNETIIDKERYSFPTTYRFNDANYAKCWLIFVLCSFWLNL